MEQTKKTVIIIGAGPAGLSAAYELLKESEFKVIILEASSDTGGISKTLNYKGNHIDIGGHRFFTKSSEINKIWTEIMPLQGSPAYDDKILKTKKTFDKAGVDPEKVDNVFLKRHRVSRIYFLRRFFDYPISIKPRTFINMGFPRTVKSGFGYIKSTIKKRPENSLEDFYINRFGKTLYKLFFEGYTEKLWGVHPKYLSASWGSQRVKGLSLTKAIFGALSSPFKKKEVETSLIEEFMYPKYGPGQFFNELAKKVTSLGGIILKEEEVTKVNLENKTIKSLTTKDNKTFIGDFFISSMPIKDLATSIGKEEMPEDVYEISTTLPYRDFITVGILLDKLKIKNKTKIKTLGNIVPDNWIYVQDRDVKMGRIQIFNNWSPYMTKDPLNTVWIGLEYFCNEGDSFWEATDKDFISMATEELVRMGIIESSDNVLESTRIKMKKAYPAYFGSYNDFPNVQSYLDSIFNLYCIGRNGQHRYNNMDHSMLSGITAARNIKNGIIDKRNIWNVNTEKNYQEKR